MRNWAENGWNGPREPLAVILVDFPSTQHVEGILHRFFIIHVGTHGHPRAGACFLTPNFHFLGSMRRECAARLRRTWSSSNGTCGGCWPNTAWRRKTSPCATRRCRRGDPRRVPGPDRCCRGVRTPPPATRRVPAAQRLPLRPRQPRDRVAPALPARAGPAGSGTEVRPGGIPAAHGRRCLPVGTHRESNGVAPAGLAAAEVRGGAPGVPQLPTRGRHDTHQRTGQPVPVRPSAPADGLRRPCAGRELQRRAPPSGRYH